MRLGRLEYKWVALTNTTLGMLMATINASILLIALPDIFRGIHINPLEPSNTSLLLWLIMGYMVVTAVLVVGLGRFSDRPHGRQIQPGCDYRLYQTGPGRCGSPVDFRPMGCQWQHLSGPGVSSRRPGAGFGP